MVKAYAKINLGLRIIRKREDGYHDIETVFHRINLFDEISFEVASTISLSCNEPQIPLDERNLCIRAAQILQNACGTVQGAHISLNKRIPIGAGLGGGSSDAASTLRGLLRLWNRNVDERILKKLAIQLGSDVPYFLNDGSAYASGRGEILGYVQLDIPYWIVLVYPNLHISTAWAYTNAQVRRSGIPAGVPPGGTLKAMIENISDLHQLSTLLHNDFEPVVFKEYPIVKEVKEKLIKRGAGFAQMSGSGSAVYGFFADESAALRAVDEFGKNYQASLTSPHFIPESVKLSR
jgi:4-diphosphocytidyl-2-C-methyl-D-erythritol kinase